MTANNDLTSSSGICPSRNDAPEIVLQKAGGGDAGSQVREGTPQSAPDESQADSEPQKSEEQIAVDQCVEALTAQWQACIDELRQLSVASSRAPIQGLNNLLKVQQRALDKATQKKERGLLSPANYFGIKSCCWEDRWAVVKKSRGLVCVNKEFPRSPRVPVPPGSGWLAFKDGPFQEKSVSVDAVVDSGATWLKFISIPPKTLEYQVMAEGWESEGDDDEDEEAGAREPSDGLAHTEFVDAIRKLALAARWNYCPHIHLLLPGLREGESEVVERVLDYVRTKLGGSDISVTISCANSPFLTDAPPDISAAIESLVGERDLVVGEDCRRLAPTVNLDPSALTSLVTDLHHGPNPLQPLAQQEIIARSVLDHETENNDLVSRQDILANVLFPALRGRKLVCTRFAASYFRQLISSISTSSEEARASLIIPPEGSGATREELIEKLQKLSSTPLPSDLLLPVEIVDDIAVEEVESFISDGRLPPMSLGIARDLSKLNCSVYLYGWANRLTTVTGHRGIERQIQLSLATHWKFDEDGLNDHPPDIWHRHLGGYLIHRDKPKNWREMIPGVSEGGPVPQEVIRWTYPWTTWGRGISTYGVPDTKTWPGVGHDEMQGYGRRMERRERAAAGDEEDAEEGEGQQS